MSRAKRKRIAAALKKRKRRAAHLEQALQADPVVNALGRVAAWFRQVTL